MDAASTSRALTSTEIVALLAKGPFAAAAARGSALVVGGGSPLAAIYATQSALNAFGARDLAALNGILFDADSPGARRLRGLAHALPLGAAPRLESLRFYRGRMPIPVGWLCARVAGRDGEEWLVAAAPARMIEPSEEARPTATTSETAAIPEREPERFTPMPIDGPVRFLWNSDAEGRFGATDAALAARLGPNAPGAGETLDALRSRAALDPADGWAEAMAARRTFSGLRLVWPEPGGARARVVALSGAPVFERERGFAGFRGFGVFTGESVSLAGAEPGPAPSEPGALDPPQAGLAAPIARTAEAPDDAWVRSPQAREHDGDEIPAAGDAGAEPAPPASLDDGEAAPAPRLDIDPPRISLLEPDLITVMAALAPAPRAETSSEVPAQAGSDDDAAAPRDDAQSGILPPERAAADPASERQDPDTPAEGASRDATASMADSEASQPAGALEALGAAADDAFPTLAPFGREGGAEIFLLRPANAPPAIAPNVVPFRPAALGVSAPVPEPPEPPPRIGDSVELSSHERDAFREIARTLGVRARGRRPESDDVEPPAIRTPAEPSDRDIAMLVDFMPIGVLVTRSGEAIYLNRTLLDLLGFSSLEAIRAAGGLDALFRGRDPSALLGEGGDVPLVAANGEVIHVDAHARSISWEGEPAVLIALRRSRALEHEGELRAVEREAQARAADARDLAAALDLASDGMIRLDGGGRILGMNRRAEEWLGYDQKETAGESFLMFFAPASQAEAAAALDRVARETVAPAQSAGVELIARERGGRAIPARVDFGRLAGSGAPEYFALLRDLTHAKTVERERDAAREAAEKASARKTEFLSRVSHEIRTPLHAILGFAEVMMEERFGPIGNERYKDYIKDIHASGRHVMSLANDLLDLSKIEAGKMELQFAPVDANRIIRECVALMQPQAARERIIMRLSLFDKLPNVMADERSLRQIMLNLMSNAVKFNEPGGQVIISTALDETGHSVIRVRDTGLGMNEAELGVALEPFRRVPGAAREGTGLGLPLTKALAEANHADFSIKSRKEQGTLVEVAFPSARAAQ